MRRRFHDLDMRRALVCPREMRVFQATTSRCYSHQPAPLQGRGGCTCRPGENLEVTMLWSSKRCAVLLLAQGTERSWNASNAGVGRARTPVRRLSECSLVTFRAKQEWDK